ncbi:caspase-3-like [Mercenaria mercenaria]|uniref:caspase-3-like n=1 Tax=Mercenaria mercenaria TaxID=6596 RepID=UPI00234EA787|nr:caspase-3-like [Mercenaria mercenaria]
MEPDTDNNTVKSDAEVTDAANLGALKEAIIRPLKKLLHLSNDPVSWDESDEYKFTHPCRGIVVIFNMERVKGENVDSELREGSSIDVDSLKETFKNLGFNICYKENQTKKQVMETLAKESKRDHSNEDCFACVILTHGGSYYRVHKTESSHKREDMIMAADTPLLTSDLLKLFHDNECKTLKGKPKLFFVQACRGDKFDKGVYLQVEDEVDAKPADDSMEFSPCPIYKDFLIMYATPPGFYAFRHPEKGSWFIQALCKTLSSPGVRNRSLHQLLTSVIHCVCVEYEAQALQFLGYKQTPCFVSMLVKDVYFRPKIKSIPI